KVAATAERDLQENFQAKLVSLHKIQDLRHTALTERCGELVFKPRIHAALEDNALDLLYPNAKDELRDLMRRKPGNVEKTEPATLVATFCRFLDGEGGVITPPNPSDFGELTSTEQSQLKLPKVPAEQQIG